MCIFSVWCDEKMEEEERKRTIRLSEEEEKIAHAHTRMSNEINENFTKM